MRVNVIRYFPPLSISTVHCSTWHSMVLMVEKWLSLNDWSTLLYISKAFIVVLNRCFWYSTLIVRQGRETDGERARALTMKSIAVLLRHRPIIENENRDVCSGFTFRSHKSIVPLNWVMDSVTQPSPFPSFSSACPFILIKVSITLSCPSREKKAKWYFMCAIHYHTHAHTHTLCYVADV